MGSGCVWATPCAMLSPVSLRWFDRWAFCFKFGAKIRILSPSADRIFLPCGVCSRQQPVEVFFSFFLFAGGGWGTRSYRKFFVPPSTAAVWRSVKCPLNDNQPTRRSVHASHRGLRVYVGAGFNGAWGCAKQFEAFLRPFDLSVRRVGVCLDRHILANQPPSRSRSEGGSAL